MGIFMNILKLYFVVMAFSTVSWVHAVDDSINQDFSSIIHPPHPIHVIQPQVELLQQRLSEQEFQLKTQDEKIETLQKIVAAMENPNRGYHKLISPDLGLWLTLFIAGGMGYAKYNEGFFAALVVFYTTFCSIYWGFKETRNWIVARDHP